MSKPSCGSPKPAIALRCTVVKRGIKTPLVVELNSMIDAALGVLTPMPND